MIFILQGDLGDQITMLPAVKAYRDKHSGPKTGGSRYQNAYAEVYAICNPLVKALIPRYEWLLNEREMPMVPHDSVISLNVWKAVEQHGKDLHPTQMFFRYLGLGDPGEVVRPEIVVDDAAPAYDYVIAPFANDPARAMPYALLARILDHFHSQKQEVCVVGSLTDEAGIPEPDYAEACLRQHLLGKPLPYVAGLMRNARKAVITVDSMVNRLAHAAGVENHVLLCSCVVPEAWGWHPGVRMLHGYPELWMADKVLELLP